MGYKESLAKRTGSMGPKGVALWPKINGTTGQIYSMGATPLIYNTTTGIYNTAYDANAAVSSPSFKNFFGKRRSRKSRRLTKSRKSRRLTRKRSYGKQKTKRTVSSRPIRRNGRSRRLKRSVKRRWKNPSRKDRRKMMHKCGPECFLRPENLGFPICNPNCKINKYGLEAAYKRARQYGYNDVAKKAKSMLKSRK